MNEQIKEILTSYENGQKKQACKQINEYGGYFWEDLRFWISKWEWMPSKQFELYMEIVIVYNKLFPHPNQIGE